ncbi:MAG: response regulator [Planctomycetes bacterium]|nr:response regulator [Planctomycetota bacterium]
MSSPRRILIVDDEPQIRMVLTAYLSGCGFSCTQAGGRDEALAILEQGPVDQAIVDLHLGMESGLQLIQLITQRWPGVKIVAMSGSVASAPQAAHAAGAAGFVGKPFLTLNEIADALRDASGDASRLAH